jgi:hypothetical protein
MNRIGAVRMVDEPYDCFCTYGVKVASQLTVSDIVLSSTLWSLTFPHHEGGPWSHAIVTDQTCLAEIGVDLRLDQYGERKVFLHGNSTCASKGLISTS